MYDVVRTAGSVTAEFSWGQFFMSPGFGGLAAVGAALVAYIGVSRTVKAQRDAARKQQWWERARWALDLTLSEDSTTRAVGFEVLDALAQSEWASEHEAEVIDAAVLPVLETYAEQEAASGAVTGSEAHLSSVDEEGSSVTSEFRSTSRSRSAGSGRVVSKSEARAAAKLKVTIDKKLGRTTDHWVERLAKDS